MKAIIVGTAASLLKKKAGNIIDSFDYIIRPITSLLAKGYDIYTGIKTNMFWVSFQSLDLLSLIPEQTNLLYLFSSDDEYTEFFPLCNTVPSLITKNRYYLDLAYEGVNKKINKQYFITNKISCQVNAELGFKHPHTVYDDQKGRVSATSGINTIYYVLNYMNFDQIYVTGFDFYKTGFYWQPDVKKVSMRPFPYKEMIFYNKLIQDKKIYEL
jgi:hypothetical protein